MWTLEVGLKKRTYLFQASEKEPRQVLVGLEGVC